MVYGFVKERNGLDMLKDDRVLVATADVSGRLGNKAEVGSGTVTMPRHTVFPS